MTFSQARAELLVANGKLPKDREVLWHMSRGRCFWCDQPMLMTEYRHPKFMTVDHVHPRGSGLSRRTKIASCYCCNHERGRLSAALYWERWRARLAGAAA